MTDQGLRVRIGRRRPTRTGTETRAPLRLLAFVTSVLALVLGLAVLPFGWVEPLLTEPPDFAIGEVMGWAVLAAITGGISFGGRRRRPPVVAAGLVGAAALLGAGPVECAAIALAGALGGMRSRSDHEMLRLVTSTLIAWAMPGILAMARSTIEIDGVFGEGLPVGSVLALWVFLAAVIPLVESLGTHLVLPPVDRIDPAHMLSQRIEPQSVLTALAVLAAMIYAAIGWTAGLVVLLPAAAARVGFAKHDEGRRAVAQTLAAMTALPEWVGIIDPGHTGRVRGVAERVAVDLGLESRVRHDVVRAAELHELGHLEGGNVSDDRGRIARSGAAVLEQAGMQGRVVRILDATDPDRVLQSPDADVELGAAIVAAACELDRMGPIPDVTEAATRVKVALGKARRSAGDYL